MSSGSATVPYCSFIGRSVVNFFTSMVPDTTGAPKIELKPARFAASVVDVLTGYPIRAVSSAIYLLASASSVEAVYDEAITDDKPIEISDLADLNKIGCEPNFPASGHYQQTRDLDVTGPTIPIGTGEHPFTGIYDFNGHKITGLSHSLFGTTGGNAEVKDGVIISANIKGNQEGNVAAVIREMNDTSTVTNIKVLDSIIDTRSNVKHKGIGFVVGLKADNSKILNCEVINSTITVNSKSFCVGGVVGLVEGRNVSIEGIKINGVSVEVRSTRRGENLKSGGGGGIGCIAGESAVNGFECVNSKIKTTVPYLYSSGILSGQVGHAFNDRFNVESKISNVRIQNCSSEIDASWRNQGGGIVGFVGEKTECHVSEIEISDSYINLHKGNWSPVGFVAGKVKGSLIAENITVDSSVLVTNGYSSNAGPVGDTLGVVNVKGIYMKNTNISTHGSGSCSGFVVGSVIKGTADIENVTVDSCNIQARGVGSCAGFVYGGLGLSNEEGIGSIKNSEIINSAVCSDGEPTEDGYVGKMYKGKFCGQNNTLTGNTTNTKCTKTSISHGVIDPTSDHNTNKQVDVYPGLLYGMGAVASAYVVGSWVKAYYDDQRGWALVNSPVNNIIDAAKKLMPCLGQDNRAAAAVEVADDDESARVNLGAL